MRRCALLAPWSQRSVSAVLLSLTAAVDVLCLLVSGVLDRSSHGEPVGVDSVLHTAWPYLTGGILLVGWRLLAQRGIEYPVRTSGGT